jgi:membrane fusion protein (multidrug efflux system)
MRKKLLVFAAGLITCLLVVVGPLVLIKKRQFEAMGEAGAAMVMPAIAVNAAPAKQERWPNTLSTPGSLDAVQGVVVASEVGGKVVKIAFEPGAAVKAGDILVQLDVSTEEANLRAAESAATLANATLGRTRNLHQSGITSPAELDASDAAARQATAQAQSIRATIAKKTIRAPFGGRLGLRQVNLGQILREGDPIATLQTLDPIYVNFSLPQQNLSQIAPGTVVRVTTDAAPEATFDGRINAISPEVDPATRSLHLQATIANGDEKLRPGMYASVQVVMPTETPVLMIPATSVIYAPYGSSVFIIDEKKDEKSGKPFLVLRQQFIRLGGARGDFVNVVDGLKVGENVVTSGVFKLRPGTHVVIDNTLAPGTDLAPKPDNT